MGGISVFILMTIFSFVLFIFIAIFIAIIIYEVITYIFESMAIMQMSKNLKYKVPFTEWIPFYNKYLLGKIVGNKILGIIVAVLNGITAVSGTYCYIQTQPNPAIFIIFLLCVLIGFILDIIISHKIYKNATNKYGDIYTILSILTLGILRPIFLFIVRNKVKKTNETEIMEMK